MRMLAPLLAIPFALAHTGEAVEQHSTLEIALDTAGGFFMQHGALVFGIIFGIAVVMFLFWLFRKK